MSVRSDPREWRDARHLLGLQGEAAAIRFLQSTGWQVLEHRFRVSRIEVDLIIRKGSIVAFVEVKTRRGSGFGSPFEAVTWNKRREIGRVAQAWVDRHGRPGDTFRFDVVGVVCRAGAVTDLVHMEDAFRLVR